MNLRVALTLSTEQGIIKETTLTKEDIITITRALWLQCDKLENSEFSDNYKSIEQIHITLEKLGGFY